MYDGDSPLLGDGTVPPAALTAWLAQGGRQPGILQRYAPGGVYVALPANVGAMIVEACREYAPVVANSDLVTADISKEAAFGQSRLIREKANPSGLGAENDDSTGTAFDKAIDFTQGGTVPYEQALREGIRATVAHWLTYAAGNGPWTANDPRLPAMIDAGYVGAAPRLRMLNGRWAWPGVGYGEDIAERADTLVAWAALRGPWMATQYEHVIPGMVDIRHLLATAQPGAGGVERGPYERLELSRRRGVVVHYRGAVTSESQSPGYASYQADATYHVGKNWSKAGQPPVLGSGIMYHVGVGFDGTAYLLRDLDRVLWHCGAWPQNENTLAIQLPLGGAQRATAAQLATLDRVVDAWLAYTGAPRSEVWGHRELSQTDCPGTLLADFVVPFRKGDAPPVPEPAPAIPPGGAVPDPWGSPHVPNAWIPTVFKQWLDAHGGFWAMGYVYSPAFFEDREERAADGTVKTVQVYCQYYEGGRLEWHPTNPVEYRVLRGLTGIEAATARYGAAGPA
jgi:hypothetical protein